MASSKATNIIAWILVGLAALGYLLAGVGKITGAQDQMFIEWGYATWFALLIGILEIAGAIGLLVPGFSTRATYGLSAIMLGAMYTHIANDELADLLRPIIFLSFMWIAWWLRNR